MKSHNTVFKGLIHAVGVLIYVAAVAWVMSNGEQLFGKMTNLLGPIAVLLLLVLSATVVGLLVFGKPVLMYLDGAKKDAIMLLTYTVTWLIAVTVVVFLVLLARIKI